MPTDVVAIIPARFGSTRFPGKPLVSIKGKTLLERTYQRVRLCPDISRIIIATDDERIEHHAHSFHAEVAMTGKNCANGTDRLAEVVANDPSLLSASAIVNVQGDEPCIDPHTITLALTALFSSPENSIGTVVSPITQEKDIQNPSIVKCVKTLSNRALYFSRSPIPGSKTRLVWPAATPFFRHIGIFAFRPEFLPLFASLPPTPLQQYEDLEMLRALEHGYHIGVALAEQHGPDVNTPEDIEEVTRWIENQSFYS